MRCVRSGFCVTAPVQIRVANVLGVVDTEDAAKVITVIRFKIANVVVSETLRYILV